MLTMFAFFLALACAKPEPPPKQDVEMTKPIPAEVQQAIETAVSYTGEREARRAAVKKLAELGHPAAVLPLTAMLDGTEGSEWLAEDIRAALVRLNGREVLLRKMASTSIEEKIQALDLLALLGDRQAVDPVTAQLGHADKKVREKAAAALGRLGDIQAVPALAKALSDSEAEVRVAAAYSLGFLGGPQAIAALEQAQSKEQDGFVKMALERGVVEAKQK